jgi:anti-sigma B factor antagonist
MSQAKATMSARKASNEASIIDIQGEVTAAAENALMDAYTQASTGGAHAIILNFRELEYMNSSGIGLVVTLLIRVNRHAPRQRLLACGLSDHYKQIFELTRLNEAIGIYNTEAEALAAVS